MIDWVTCRIPVRLPQPIAGGWTVKINRDGVEQARTPHRLPVEGSFSSSLTIRAPSTTELEISGNPLKWLQGHNLYGTDDLLGLIWATLERLQPHLGGSLAEVGLEGPRALHSGILTQVHCTEMLELESLGDVLFWIRSAYATGYAKRRGRGVMREGTLVFGHSQGKSMTRWQIVIYAKGSEIEDHPLPDLMAKDHEVRDWVRRCLRVEVRLGRLELKDRGLRSLGGWSNTGNNVIPILSGKAPVLAELSSRLAGRVLDLWNEKVGSLSFNDEAMCDTVDLKKLPRHLRGTYAQWKLGADLRDTMSKPTFHRHRTAIQRLTGVDVAVPPAPSSTAQVLPIKRALQAQPVGRPPWADRIDAQLCAAGAVILTNRR